MYVWSKRVVFGLLGTFAVLMLVFWIQEPGSGTSMLKPHTTRFLALNYIGLVIWVFVWMLDQARVRGKNVWLWLAPFFLVPLPTLMVYILFLQRKVKA